MSEHQEQLPKTDENRSAMSSIEMLDIEENLKKYDSESVLTENRGIMARVVTVMAMVLSLFQLYLASPWGTMPSAKAAPSIWASLLL